MFFGGSVFFQQIFSKRFLLFHRFFLSIVFLRFFSMGLLFPIVFLFNRFFLTMCFFFPIVFVPFLKLLFFRLFFS